MCVPMLAGLAAGGGAAAGAGAAAAATAGSLFQTLGLIASVAGPLVQGVQTARAARENAAAIERQRQTELQLSSVREERSRAEFRRQIARQRAELTARGLSMDSPTAVFLGQTAAREMSFESQSIRSGAMARDQELTDSQRAMRARGRAALFRGGLSAAGNFLTGAPEVWPELLA